MNVKAIATAVLVTFGLASTSAFAATSTSTMPVKIIIQNACNVATTAPTTLDFATQGPLVANVDSTAVITLTCTSGANYNVGLDGGGAGAANIGARRMINGTNVVAYQLYRDAGHTNVWGNTIGTDTAAGSGTGTTQTLTVYGRVPPQTTPPAATYNDTVNVTVTY
ncbi:MAG TPA: spore coat U domain-containing protein [Rhodanobacteraceae bacterium]|jgi:spore coat protein U-like protein|nr:spore coat U domain-containing protein [Rhodanobacteraceae bacterium]